MGGTAAPGIAYNVVHVSCTGAWRVLDFDHLSTVMSHIVHLAEERDWLHAGVPLQDCLDVLQELFPR